MKQTLLSTKGLNQIMKKILPLNLYLWVVKHYGFYKASAFYKKNRRLIKKVLDSLEDNYSKKTLLAYMKLQTTGDTTELLHLTRNKKEQYFDKTVFKLGIDEVFVDMGVYNGATSLEFAERVGHRYGGILLFEPDKKCFEISKKNVSELSNTIIWQEACSDIDKKIYFSDTGLGNASISTESTGNIVHAVKLDSKLRTVPYKPTMIKMDIEGAEAAALRGASNTIMQLKPKLAVCIYHKPQDIWELPLLIKKIMPDYKLYIRHYDIRRKGIDDVTALSWELVCYAVV